MNQLMIQEKIFLNIAVLFLGYFIKKSRKFPENSGDVLSKIVLYITLPATILTIFSQYKIDARLFILAFISIILGVLTFIFGYFVVKKVNLDNSDKWTLLVSICGYNIGLFALPFIQQVYGNEGIINMAMFDMGNSFIVFGFAYGVSFLAGGKTNFNLKEVSKKIIYFFPLDVYISALLMNLFNINFTGMTKEFIYQLSLPNNILALFTIGYFLDFNLNKNELKALIIGLFVKFLPGVALILTTPFLFDTKLLIIKIITIGAILPTPMVAVIYAKERGLNAKLASVFITASIIISILLMTYIMLRWQ